MIIADVRSRSEMFSTFPNANRILSRSDDRKPPDNLIMPKMANLLCIPQNTSLSLKGSEDKTTYTNSNYKSYAHICK